MSPVLTTTPETGLAPPKKPTRWSSELELRQGRLCPEPLATLEAIWIRYTIHGMRHEQRVPFSEPPAVRCGLTAGR